jgi:Protein of unknown function (DUF3445)
MPIEFPVRVPYTTAPNMVRNTGVVINPEPRQDYIRQKHHELNLRGNDLWAELPGASLLIRQATNQLGLVETSSIVSFALQIEEDVAVMFHGRLVAICFCFPSSWIPRERIGMTLTDIHSPVADGDKLQAMSQRIAETMADPAQGSFRRHVWTISNSGALSQHPANKSDRVPNTIDDLWFRLETQTTMPLGDGDSSLFFVRVQTEPLTVIWKDTEKRQTLLDSVNSMTDNVLEYKNLHYIKELLNKKMTPKGH